MQNNNADPDVIQVGELSYRSIMAHLNIVVCNCNCCVTGGTCNSRVQTVIANLNHQIENIKDDKSKEWKQQIKKIIESIEFN
jgi:hypothetical protein